MASTPAHHASPAAVHAHGYHTPSSMPVHPHASELDTTMEDADEEEQQQIPQEDDVFSFNAPSYYDLKHPEREQQYVNNADGYFYRDERLSGGLSTAPPPSPPTTFRSSASPAPAVLQTPQRAPPAVLQTPQRAPPAVVQTPQRTPSAALQTPHRTPLAVLQTPQRPPSSADHNGRTPQTPFGMYRDPQTEVPSQDSDQEMDQDDADEEQQQQHLPTEDDDRMSDGGDSDGTLDLEALATTGSGPASAPSAPSSSATMAGSLPPPPRSLGHSFPSSSSSSLLQPTQAYLLRLQAEQAAREHQHQHQQTADHHHAHSHTTQAKAPLLRTSQRSHSADHLRMSSTSREIQKIQEEKTRMQLETMKMREFHERTRKQRVATNVLQRSTKQLTIPQSPFLEVGHRSTSRRRNQLNQSMSSSEGEGSSHADEPHPHLAPEQFLSRDYEFQATHNKSHNAGEVTVPHTPQLRTSERAAARRNVFPGEEEAEEHKPDYSKMKVNGVTRPLTPQLETDRRAAQAAAYRRPIEVVDNDEEELNRKFHARPVPRQVLEAHKSSPQKAAASKPSLTKPVSPKLATSSRARSIFPEEEPEKKPLSTSSGPRRTGPTVPETPPLRSLQRHQMYQENMRRRQEAEEEEMRKQREFKAQPIRLTTNPLRFEGSKKPLTEVQPFDLRGDRLHERAVERIERLRREEEERLRAAQQFRAMPMPAVTDNDMRGGGHHTATERPPAKPLTKASSPKFATNRRAAERAAFEAAERERRAHEEEQRRQMEEERRRQDEEEIKRMRRDEMVFHARPVPAPKAFELKPNTRPLTEPESPYLQTKIRGGATSTTAA